MKPIFLASTFLSTVLCLGAAPSQAAPFNGAYAGVQGGYERIDNNASFTGGLIGTATGNMSGISGGIFAGYGKSFNQLYLGAEAEGNLSGASDSSLLQNASVTSKRQGDVGASIRAGFFPINNVLVYGRAGLVASKFEYSVTGNLLPGVAVTGNNNEWFSGWRLGAGTEAAISGNWLARLDWSYTDYGDKKAAIAVNGVSNTTAKISPTGNTFRMGVAYAF